MKNFVLDKESKVKLYHQLYLIFAEAINSGDMKYGTKLPSIRVLAENHGISRNTVTKAYEELEKEGFIYSMSKSGYFVKDPNVTVEIQTEKKSVKHEKIVEDEDGIPTVDAIIREHQSASSESIIAENPAEVEDVEDTAELSEETSLVTENVDAEDIHKFGTFINKNPFDSGTLTPPVLKSALNLGKKKKPETILLESGDSIKVSGNEKESKIISPEEALVESYKNALVERKSILFGNRKKSIQGDESFRIAIAAFLWEFHKINVNPANIIVGADLTQLMFNVLSLRTLRHPKPKVRGLLQMAEKTISSFDSFVSPCIAGAKGIDKIIKNLFESRGIRVEEISNDAQGIITDELIESKASLAWVSSTDIDKDVADGNVDRIDEIIAWTDAADYRYIFEYDLSTSVKNISAFATLRPEKTIYINSFTNLLSRSVNASFIVLPTDLLENYRQQFEGFDCPLSVLDQCALTDFLIKGKLINYLDNLETL